MKNEFLKVIHVTVDSNLV